MQRIGFYFRLRSFFFAFVAFAFCGQVFAQDSTTPKFTDRQIVDMYIELAFGDEMRQFGLGARGDHIWKRDQSKLIRIVPHIKPSVPLAEPLSLLKRVVRTIEERSGGLNLQAYDETNIVEFLGQGKQKILTDLVDGVLVHIGSREELEASLKKVAASDSAISMIYESVTENSHNTERPFCLAVGSPRTENSRFIGMSIAWVEYGPALEECFYEEIMQIFGIGSDLPGGTPSMFNDDGVYKKPTPLDWIIWRIHTDPRIKAGMGKRKVRKIALKILAEIGE